VYSTGPLISRRYAASAPPSHKRRPIRLWRTCHDRGRSCWAHVGSDMLHGCGYFGPEEDARYLVASASPPPAGRPLDILSPLVTGSVCVWAYGGVLAGSTHGLLFASMTCIREGGPLRRDHRCPPALGHPLGRLLGHRDHPAAYVGLTGTSRKKLGWCAPGARWIGAALHEPLTSDPERPVGQSNRMRRRC